MENETTMQRARARQKVVARILAALDKLDEEKDQQLVLSTVMHLCAPIRSEEGLGHASKAPEIPDH